MNIKVGNFVKLKDYSVYSDYKKHDGEACKIINIGNTRYPEELNIDVIWDDYNGMTDGISCIKKENILNPEWDG